MLSYPSSSLEDYSCKVNTKALSLTDSANYITTENRKVRHLSISSQPRKPYHRKRNNTNNYRYYFSLCLAFENIRRCSVVSYSTFLTIQSAGLKKKGKRKANPLLSGTIIAVLHTVPFHIWEWPVRMPERWINHDNVQLENTKRLGNKGCNYNPFASSWCLLFTKFLSQKKSELVIMPVSH